MVGKLQEFSMEALEKAISEAVEAEEKAGGRVVTFEKFAEAQQVERRTFDETRILIKQYFDKLEALGRLEEYKQIAEEHLGVGHTVKDATSRQLEQLELIIYDLEQLGLELS
jgi:hypothetical protein